MNKNTIIGVIIIVLIALGMWYFYSSKNINATTETATTTVSGSTDATTATGIASNTTTAKPAGTSTFRSIFTQSGNHQCSYEQVGTSNRTSSVVYIADGKMRGEFRTMSGNDTVANLMIYDGGYLYSWREGMTVGKKTTIRTVADLPSAIPQDLTSGAILGVSMDSVGWDCHDWAKDPKIFVIPTYVKFSS